MVRRGDRLLVLELEEHTRGITPTDLLSSNGAVQTEGKEPDQPLVEARERLSTCRWNTPTSVRFLAMYRKRGHV